MMNNSLENELNCAIEGTLTELKVIYTLADELPQNQDSNNNAAYILESIYLEHLEHSPNIDSVEMFYYSATVAFLLGVHYIILNNCSKAEPFFEKMNLHIQQILKTDADAIILVQNQFNNLVWATNIFQENGNCEQRIYIEEKVLEFYKHNKTILSEYNNTKIELLYDLYGLYSEAKRKYEAKKALNLLKKSIWKNLKSSRCREIYADISIWGEYYKYLFEHKTIKFIVIGLITLLFCWNLVGNLFYAKTNNSLLTAFNVYKYDGSSVINSYKEVNIDNTNYTYGLQLKNAGRVCEAIPLFETALEELKIVYSEETPEIAQAHMYLGLSYLNEDRLPEAYEHFSNAYVSYKSYYGEDSENAQLAKLYWGVCSLQSSDYQTALIDIESSFSALSYFADRQVASYYLLEVLKLTGDFNHAIEWGEKSLGYCSCVYGENLGLWGTSVFFTRAEIERELGRAYLVSRNFTCAETLLNDAINDLDNAQNASDYNNSDFFINNLNNQYAEVYQALSVLKQAQGYYDSASKYYDLSMDYYNKDLGEYDSLLLLSQSAVLRNDEDLFNILENNLEKAIAINGKYNTHVVNHLVLLSDQYLFVDNQKAAEYGEEALDIQMSLLERNDSLTARIYRELSAAYIQLGRYDDAINYAKLSLKNCIAIYGLENHYSLVSLSLIQACCHQKGNDKGALIIVEFCESQDFDIDYDVYSRENIKKYKKEYEEILADREIIESCKKRASMITEDNFYDSIVEIIGE